MRISFLGFFCLVLGLTSAVAGGSKPGFAFRIYVQAATGSNPAQGISMAIKDPDQVISVHKFAVLTEKHVAGLMKLPDGGTVVTLTDTGTKILETETSNRMGAIMVILCNGRLIFAPEIDAPIRSDKIILPPGLLEDDYTLFRRYLIDRNK